MTGVETNGPPLKARKRKAESRTHSNSKTKKAKVSQELSDEKNLSNVERLSLEDVICPICLSILVEPVTLPCKHTLCHQCFDDNVNHTAYKCPLCRVRIGVWKRKATKTGSLVNFHLWEWIQNNFKEKLEARKNGKDDSQLFHPVPTPPISAPGEIAEEFERDQMKLNEELQFLREKEEMESELELKRIEAEVLKEKESLRVLCKEDEVLAKRCQEEQFLERKAEILAQSPNISSKKKSKINTIDAYLDQSTPQRNRKSQFPYNPRSEMFSSPVSGEKINTHCDTDNRNILSNSTNNPSLSIPLCDLPVPHTDSESEPKYVTHPKKSFKFRYDKENKLEHPGISSESLISPAKCSHSKPTDLVSSSVETDDNILSYLAKFDCGSLGEGSGFGDMDPKLLESFIEEQKAEELRLMQVREDQKVAFQLQKDMTKIDRSKGSEDEYGLRKKEQLSSNGVLTLLKSPIVLSKKNSRKVNKTPKLKISAKAESPSFRQTTIIETLSKRRLSEEY